MKVFLYVEELKKYKGDLREIFQNGILDDIPENITLE